MLAALFLLGSLGTGAELVLLEHTEGFWQSAPLALTVAGCLAAAPVFFRARGAWVRGFQVLMGLFVASGLAGVTLHYESNLEFERELQPETAGLKLVWAAMKGATPALAPGTMILLGGLGLASTLLYARSGLDSHPDRADIPRPE